jgi:hypothetical protein
MRMGSVALSAAFLSVAAQSAASAQGNPNVDRALNRAAQVSPVDRDFDFERNFTQQQNTNTDTTQLTVIVPGTRTQFNPVRNLNIAGEFLFPR